jgi:mannan endo-1,4-beta-mannosidase
MCWSEIIRTGNPLDRVISVYHAPRMVNRDDPRLAVPMAAMRKFTTDHLGNIPSADLVSPNPTNEASLLLMRLYAAPGTAVFSGQENDPTAPSAATASVFQATGKQPAIYATDLGSSPTGSVSAEARKPIAAEAIRTHKAHADVSLSWRPSRPTDDAAANAKNQLTDFEWNDLLTPGSTLNRRWLQQVDDVAETLRALDKAGVAILWNPFPESNGANFWWAGRKGVRGSSELYRQLFDRLVNHDGLHNLVWVWEATAPEFRADGGGLVSPGMPSDFFPGYLYADVLEIRLNQLSTRFPAGLFLSQIALDKPIGVELSSDLPAPAALTQNSGFAWFLAAPPVAASADSAARTDALRALYGDPHIVPLAPAQ